MLASTWSLQCQIRRWWIMKNGQTATSGEIFWAIYRCEITTCSSGPNLIVVISYDKNCLCIRGKRTDHLQSLGDMYKMTNIIYTITLCHLRLWCPCLWTINLRKTSYWSSVPLWKLGLVIFISWSVTAGTLFDDAYGSKGRAWLIGYWWSWIYQWQKRCFYFVHKRMMSGNYTTSMT